MSRTLIASLAGIGGFIVYVIAVLQLSDLTLGLPWPVEAAFFAAAGIIWVWPAKWLIAWAVRGRR
jgi:hypothetical protein